MHIYNEGSICYHCKHGIVVRKRIEYEEDDDEPLPTEPHQIDISYCKHPLFASIHLMGCVDACQMYDEEPLMVTEDDHSTRTQKTVRKKHSRKNPKGSQNS